MNYKNIKENLLDMYQEELKMTHKDDIRGLMRVRLQIDILINEAYKSIKNERKTEKKGQQL